MKVLLRCYPRALRLERGDEIEAMCRACLERERARFGTAGLIYACLRLAADAVVQGFLFRIDDRRRRHIAALHEPCTLQRETAMNRLWQDIRFAGRGMRRAPVFTAIVVLTLGLAIGATSAVFTVVNAVLLRSLPYAEPDRLVMLYQGIPGAIATPIGFSPPDYVAFQERATFFDSMAAYRNRDYELSGVEPPERVTAVRASASLFQTLGVTPVLGAGFTREDDESGRAVAVISDGLWTRAFGRDPAVIGRALTLDRRPYTIVGVMPRQFTFPNRGPHLNNVPADVFLPISFTPRERVAFGSMYNASVVARLKPGVTATQADADTRALVKANAAELYPAALSGLAGAITASGVPLRDEIVGRSTTILLIVFGAVGFVLVIACADIATLMLTRAVSRQREIAVRSALGAGRGRIIRQLLAESALTSICGGVLGLVLAWWMSRTLVAFAPSTLPRLNEITIDARILGFTAAVSMLTALLCGLLPAWELARPDTGDALKEGARGGTAGRRHRRIFNTLVATQVALAVVLLVGGGLLYRSFARLMSVDPGIRPEHVLTLGTTLPVSGYRSAADVRTFYTRLLDAVQSLPGVSAAGTTTLLPLNVMERRAFTIENPSPQSRELGGSVAAEWVNGRYFEALGIPLKRGRYFTPQDVANAEPVVIINDTLARLYWKDTDPVGQRLAWGGATQHGPWMRIVGVVGDVKQGALNTKIDPQTYVPWQQVSDGMVAESVVGQMRSLKLAIRTAMEPTALAPAVRQQIRSLDPALPVTAVRTMEEVVRLSAATQQFNTTLLGAFALLALLLAAIGIGGVLATSVSRRTQELGVRMALGAPRRLLLRMVLREGMVLAGLGIAAGLPIAWMASRVMKALLYEIGPRDPLTFIGAASLLLAVALAACSIPAWRATQVDPMVALRRD